MKKFAVQDHELVPSHVILSPEEVDVVLKEYGVEARQLPKIHINDPVAKEIEAKVGDVIKIIRLSPTAKKSVFYRLVID
ncbi:MAG: DNA-directed RNA polymerase subunit H [Methanosarcinales archaeon]|nr:DNA-directed RNA polymerase subunit H [Methanosarcinales archaeon]